MRPPGLPRGGVHAVELCVSLSRCIFLEECLARGWTVTEPFLRYEGQPHELGLIIVATCCGACIIQNNFGGSKIPAFDIQAACSVF